MTKFINAEINKISKEIKPKRPIKNVNDLVKRGKLDPLDIHAKTKLFYRKDVIRYQNERQ